MNFAADFSLRGGGLLANLVITSDKSEKVRASCKMN